MSALRAQVEQPVRLFATSREAEQLVAGILAARIRSNPASVLGLATGASMIGVYRELARMHPAGGLSFARVTTFNLDEYCGLAAGDPSGFAAYMDRNLFDHVDADRRRLHLPEGDDAGPARYEAAIAAADGIDLQLLGIGRNGHIGFNEPGSQGTSRTRVVELAPPTLAANANDFPTGVAMPRKAITMGIETILSARRIVLLATGAAKAKALAGALEGEVGPHNPASFLQQHPDVTVVCDLAAAAELRNIPKIENSHA
ncbi:glucosamine-6-phosphate deaminase [Mesorhizobium sp. 10J20-29]